MDAALIDSVRRFNRTVTQRVGALNDAYLSRNRPLGQARLLWEVGRRPDGWELRELRARLELDSGYLSRLLRALEAEGLVEVEAGGPDGRVRTVRLTAPGRAERAELDRGSDELAAGILEPLTPGQRERLVAAMAQVERLLAASQVRVAPADPGHPDAAACLRAYFEELARRFPEGFDPAAGPTADERELTPPAGLLLLARLHGEPVGCGGLKFHPEQRGAEVKRLWVSPVVRGFGLGRRLLAELEAQAAAGGAERLVLDTNRALTEAIALYRDSGFQEVEPFNDNPYAHHWFAKKLG
jgi:DNA-binding MarR family transcriptional regulator/GNAT superfamily N-acetyltransferase